MKRVLLVASIFMLILLLVSSYSNTMYSPPILDDLHSFIGQQNVYVTDWSVSSLLSLSKTTFGWARWIPMLSFSFDHWIVKRSIVPFHVTNTLIHTCCLLSVIFLAFNLFRIVGRKDSFAEGIPDSMLAIFVAGLWALHPVQTNAVTYLVQRMASLQALFYITSISFYILGRRSYNRNKSLIKAFPFFLACFIAAGGAFLSKENSLMLPVMILVTEIWFFSPDLLVSLWKRLMKTPRVGWVVLLILLLGLTFFSVKVGRDLSGGYSGRHFTMGERVLTETRIVVWYLSLLFWPAPSRMSIEHDVVVSTSLMSPPTTLLATIFLLALGWLMIRYRKEYPLVTYGLAWFFLNLLIESSIVPLELIFEHRLYLPSVGLALSFTCMVIGAFHFLLARRKPKDFMIITGSVFALLISGLSLLTFVRNEVWRNSITIHMDTILKAPNHPRAHANLAVAWGKAGFYDRSIIEAEEAIALGQDHYEQYMVAANAIVGSLNALGNHLEAAERGEKLVEDMPPHLNAISMPVFYLDIAEAYLKLGDLNKAYTTTMKALGFAQRLGRDKVDLMLVERMLRLILQESAKMQADLDQDGAVDPGGLHVETWIARAFVEQGEREEARRLLKVSLEDNPDDLETVRLLKEIEKEDELNNTQMAKENMKEKYLSFPSSRFNACMAMAYLLRRDNLPSPLRGLGEKCLDHALEIQPEVADAHLLKAWYLRERSEIEQAIASAQRALAVDPQNAKAWSGLGFLLMESNQFTQAVSAFKKTLELYPGCPQRKTITEIITSLEQEAPFSMAENNGQ
jgi:protein O-mannosyl-transferase